MTQFDFGTLDPVPTSGRELADLLNAWRTALNSHHLGAVRPAYAVAGTIWVKVDGNQLVINVFDGTSDVVMAAIDTGSHQMLSTGAVPTGAIMQWSGGGSAPTGWAFCDGGTYPRNDGAGNILTPDLRDRFIIGASPSRAVNTTGGTAAGSTYASGAGGSHTHTTTTGGDHSHTIIAAGAHDHGGSTSSTTLTVDQIPPHYHAVTGRQTSGSNTGSASAGTTGAAIGDWLTTTVGGGMPHNHALFSGGDHVHTVQSGGSHSHTTPSGGAHDHQIAMEYPLWYALAYIMRL